MNQKILKAGYKAVAIHVSTSKRRPAERQRTAPQA
jgi:hypothetical protein